MNQSIYTILGQHSRLLVAGLLSTIAYAYLALASQSYADASLLQLYGVAAISGTLCFYLFWSYHRVDQQIPIIGLLFFAVLFRVLGVSAFPVLEDDVFRYLWDGRMSIEASSAYGLIPSDFFEGPSGIENSRLDERFDEILGLINYPDIATIYGPTNQWIFALSYLIAPAETWPLQAIYALADLALILLLLRAAKPNMVLLYAWSPLIIKEFAFTAHPDVLGALFLVAAYLAYQRGYLQRTGILLALAAGVKLFALLLVPLLLGFQWRAWLLFLFTAIAIALPWGVTEAWLPAGLVAMSNTWLFNAPIYLLLQSIFPFSSIKLALLSILLMGCAGYWLYCMKRWPHKAIRADLLFAALFICVPVVNAWYLVWMLPFAVIYPSVWPWVASVTAFLAYASGINLPNSDLANYSIHPTIIALEFSLVAVVAMLEWRRSKRNLHS